MFRSKDHMLHETRLAKKKNCNKDGKEARTDEKDLHRFELKGIQQELVKEGIRVHVNDLRALRHTCLHDLTDEDKQLPVGNTTMGVLFEKMNKNSWDCYGFGGKSDVVAKTHDMTRWSDNKEKTKIRKNNRIDKMGWEDNQLNQECQ